MFKKQETLLKITFFNIWTEENYLTYNNIMIKFKIFVEQKCFRGKTITMYTLTAIYSVH